MFSYVYFVLPTIAFTDMNLIQLKLSKQEGDGGVVQLDLR